MHMCSQSHHNNQPIKGAHLVRVNAKICGRGTQSQVSFLLLVECPGLPYTDCGGCSQNQVWIPMEGLKGSSLEGSSVIKEKVKKKAS